MPVPQVPVSSENRRSGRSEDAGEVVTDGQTAQPLDRSANESQPSIPNEHVSDEADSVVALQAPRRDSPGATNIRHFVSDLNPEATFLPRREPEDDSNEREPNDDIGVWVDKREWDALVRQKNIGLAGDSTHHASHDESQDSQRLHPSVVHPLVDVYFRKIHPLLPLLEEGEFRKDHAANVVPDPLLYAVCLAAGKDPDAEPYLKMAESTAPLTPRQFCSRLHASVMRALKSSRRYEKITIIRTMALVSLHAEGQDGPEEAALCLNQAMHYTQTLGWHLGQHAGAIPGDGLATKRLFWCLWSLDRINGVIYGRPVMMSDIDIAIEPFERGESGFPGFEIWLRICDMLNKVISFYRPRNSPSVTGWEDDFPGFETIIDENQGWDLPQSLLATLHLFYLTVAVLSHRSRGVKFVPRSTASCVRQNLCSIQLIRLMNSHLFTALHPLPILPYAISLALSVSYQHLRQARLQQQQEDARQDFATCCSVLQRLRRTWSSADTITTIAQKVLDEINKAQDLSSCRANRILDSVRASPAVCPPSLSQPDTLVRGPSDATTRKLDSAANDSHVSGPSGAPGDPDAFGLLDGLDDIFGTYLDPNYPVHLDDFSFADDLPAFDWTAGRQ